MMEDLIECRTEISVLHSMGESGGPEGGFFLILLVALIAE